MKLASFLKGAFLGAMAAVGAGEGSPGATQVAVEIEDYVLDLDYSALFHKITFSDQEIYLLGSYHFSPHAVIPSHTLVTEAMVNQRILADSVVRLSRPDVFIGEISDVCQPVRNPQSLYGTEVMVYAALQRSPYSDVKCGRGLETLLSQTLYLNNINQPDMGTHWLEGTYRELRQEEVEQIMDYPITATWNLFIKMQLKMTWALYLGWEFYAQFFQGKEHHGVYARSFRWTNIQGLNTYLTQYMQTQRTLNLQKVTASGQLEAQNLQNLLTKTYFENLKAPRLEDVSALGLKRTSHWFMRDGRMAEKIGEYAGLQTGKTALRNFFNLCLSYLEKGVFKLRQVQLLGQGIPLGQQELKMQSSNALMPESVMTDFQARLAHYGLSFTQNQCYAGVYEGIPSRCEIAEKKRTLVVIGTLHIPKVLQFLSAKDGVSIMSYNMTRIVERVKKAQRI